MKNQEFWMMVLAVIVGILLTSIVMNKLSGKEGLRQGPGGSPIDYDNSNVGFGGVFKKVPKCNNIECEIKSGQMMY